MMPFAAIIISVFESVVNGMNALLRTWTLSLAAPPNLSSSLSAGEVLLPSLALFAGVRLIILGFVTEMYSESPM